MGRYLFPKEPLIHEVFDLVQEEVFFYVHFSFILWEGIVLMMSLKRTDKR